MFHHLFQRCLYGFLNQMVKRWQFKIILQQVIFFNYILSFALIIIIQVVHISQKNDR